MEKLVGLFESFGKKIGLWDLSELGLEVIPLTLLGLFGGLMTIILVFVLLSGTHISF
jgi:hypothetical protein|tara:strand:- start:1037 stop:1207 length:171 start_codon:yes stop_codon:yes gene_type:complete